MRITRKLKPITAADNVFDEDIGMDSASDASLDEEALSDQISDMQDAVDDIQDTVEDIQEDDIDIDIDNNISGHYIAECENCKGTFISAMIVSDQEVDSINGICPLCNKDTVQQLKWYVADVSELNL